MRVPGTKPALGFTGIILYSIAVNSPVGIAML